MSGLVLSQPERPDTNPKGKRQDMPMQIMTKLLSFFKTDPKQPRKYFSETDLLSLGSSMKTFGQLQPVGAIPDGILLWGERRFRAAQLVGLKELSVIITDRLLSDSEIRLIQLTENMLRADLCGHEKWLACAELMTMNPGWQMKNLAEHLHFDPSMITRLLSPSKCIEAAQLALRDNKIGISDCYEFSQEIPERQAELLSMKLGGASRNAIKHARRKSRNGEAVSIMLSRVKIAMPQGAMSAAFSSRANNAGWTGPGRGYRRAGWTGPGRA